MGCSGSLALPQQPAMGAQVKECARPRGWAGVSKGRGAVEEGKSPQLHLTQRAMPPPKEKPKSRRTNIRAVARGQVSGQKAMCDRKVTVLNPGRAALGFWGSVPFQLQLPDGLRQSLHPHLTLAVHSNLCGPSHHRQDGASTTQYLHVFCKQRALWTLASPYVASSSPLPHLHRSLRAQTRL